MVEEPLFSISEESRAGMHRILLAGELDLETSIELGAVLRRTCEAGALGIELDLSGVTFIDSLGLRSILDARDLCAEHRVDFAVVPNPSLHKIFEVTGLLELVPWRGLQEPHTPGA
jgi:anti-anti-sigma factor